MIIDRFSLQNLYILVFCSTITYNAVLSIYNLQQTNQQVFFWKNDILYSVAQKDRNRSIGIINISDGHPTVISCSISTLSPFPLGNPLASGCQILFCVHPKNCIFAPCQQHATFKRVESPECFTQGSLFVWSLDLLPLHSVLNLSLMRFHFGWDAALEESCLVGSLQLTRF